ncbi:hypothetical protein H632_c301p1, partial [Helicosporidium sp. ATCC 50920]
MRTRPDRSITGGWLSGWSVVSRGANHTIEAESSSDPTKVLRASVAPFGEIALQTNSVFQPSSSIDLYLQGNAMSRAAVSLYSSTQRRASAAAPLVHASSDLDIEGPSDAGWYRVRVSAASLAAESDAQTAWNQIRLVDVSGKGFDLTLGQVRVAIPPPKPAGEVQATASSAGDIVGAESLDSSPPPPNMDSTLVPLYGAAGEAAVNSLQYTADYSFIMALKNNVTLADIEAICSILAGQSAQISGGPDAVAAATAKVETDAASPPPTLDATQGESFRGSCAPGLQAAALRFAKEAGETVDEAYVSVILNSQADLQSMRRSLVSHVRYFERNQRLSLSGRPLPKSEGKKGGNAAGSVVYTRITGDQEGAT